MIYSHIDGLNLLNELKKSYEYEIECLCLNSKYMQNHNLFADLEKYKRLQQDFPQNVVLKESEFNEEHHPYYECSLFCSKEQLDKFELILSDRAIRIDKIHPN